MVIPAFLDLDAMPFDHLLQALDQTRIVTAIVGKFDLRKQPEFRSGSGS
jgi:hypothetical protein